MRMLLQITNKRTMAWIVSVATLSAVGFLSWQAVRAQTANQVTISVSPTVFDLSANPGDSLNETFRIVNGTDQDLEVSATPKNFTALGEEGAVELTEDDTSFSLAKWISVSPITTTIPARGSQNFDFNVNVPFNAEPGGHFGSVIVKTEAKRLDNTSGAAVSQEAGPLILVSVAGDIKESATIESFAPLKSFWEGGPVILETRVNNQGNVHFKPRGAITIKNTFGDEVTTINLEEKNILPGTIRKLTSEWSPGFTAGRFTADLSLVYGADDTILTASTTFVVFPFKIIVPALLGAILLVYVLIRFRKRIAAAGKALAGK